MSTPVKRSQYRRRCRRCFWERTYDTAAGADYAKRRHSCRKREEATELVHRWAGSGRSLNDCARITGLKPDRYYPSAAESA